MALARLFQHVKAAKPNWKAPEVKFSQITCALSNTVYQVSRGDEKLLLRIYGSTDHGYFTRTDEVRQTCFLASQGFGPQVLHTFDEGRIESWLNGKTPTNEMMRSDAAVVQVAKKLRALHDKTGLNHNDLHRNNMMFNEDGKVEFLDFEYAGSADPSYDIANHFNEWMYSYTGPDQHLFQLGLYPSLAKRRLFAEAYLGNTSGKGSIVDDFLKEVEVRTKDSHAFWVKWAEASGPSEFNTLYAQARRTLVEGEGAAERCPALLREAVKQTPTSQVFHHLASTVGTFDGLSTLLRRQQKQQPKSA